MIWTASDGPWGEYVVKQLDPNGYIHHKLYRDKSWWQSAPAVYVPPPSTAVRPGGCSSGLGEGSGKEDTATHD